MWYVVEIKNAICKKLTWVTIVPVVLYKGDMKVIYWSALVYMSLFYIVSVKVIVILLIIDILTFENVTDVYQTLSAEIRPWLMLKK